MSRVDVADWLYSVLKCVEGGAVDNKRKESLSRRKGGVDFCFKILANQGSCGKSGGSGRNSRKPSLDPLH